MFGYGTLTTPYEFVGGDVAYEDINHDGNINELDIVYLGSSLPKINGGCNFCKTKVKFLSIQQTYPQQKTYSIFGFQENCTTTTTPPQA